MKQFIFIITLLAAVPMLAFGVNSNPKCVAPIYPMATGDEVVNAPVGPVAPQGSVLDETDDIFTIGTTWYDNQHNGTCGRMNVLEPTGYRQFVWMKGENSGASIRHIWWNLIDPNGTQLYPGTGLAVESSIKGGFCNLDVGSNGAAFPGYHEVISTSAGLPWASASMDLFPHNGAFLDFPTPVNPVITQTIWPRIQIGQNQRIHMLCTNQIPTGASNGVPQRMWYLSGTYDPTALTITWAPTWTQMDWTQTIAADVAVSPVVGSNKTLWAWTRSMAYPVGDPDPNTVYSQLNNDIYYLIDADGLNPQFSQKVNLTQFIPPNLSYLPDTLRADQDTLRAYTCLNTFIDHNNYAHIVFTTRSFFAIEGTSYWNASIIWHWSEQFPTQYKMVANYFGNPSDPRYWAYCGAWNVRAQRPSLGEDAAGHLYCMYQVYDTDSTHLSANTAFPNGNGMGGPSGEVYVSVSLDGGLSWSQGTNVTNTISPYHAALGQCTSELTPVMAKKVDTYCHIQYVYDLDAGNVIQTEGGWTNNNVVYNRVPVSSIATTPLLPQDKNLHIGAPPTLTLDVTLTPTHPPITVPAGGGTFSFSIGMQRVVGPAAPYAVWIRAKNPNGTFTGNLLGPVNINTPVGVTVTRNRNQNVPASWAPGVYAYIFYANNTYGYPPVDSSFFNFTKLADAGNGPLVWDANCYGELLPGEVPVSTPMNFAVEGAYPNPFNPTTTISYTLPEASHVNLTVFDMNGREVATLVNGLRDAGRHQVTFDGSELSSGVYFYTLTSGANVVTGKMALVK